jgi:hypothetical protein
MLKANNLSSCQQTTLSCPHTGRSQWQRSRREADGGGAQNHAQVNTACIVFVAQVAVSGSVVVEKLMEVERYSHVMHISSTVTGRLLPQLDSWDALRAALPAGTVSGAPKVCGK